MPSKAVIPSETWDSWKNWISTFSIFSAGMRERRAGYAPRWSPGEHPSVGPHGMLIAGQALARDLILVTHNTREFSRVPGLRVEDWEA